MKRLVTIGLALFPVCLSGQPPFFELREHRSEYNGPGREEEEPEGLSEVRVGYFGPSDPDHVEGGDIWLAVEWAIEQANREGGYRGLPFRLLSAWSENPWGTGIARLAQMVYSENVWAIIGSIDGASTHLAEQVVAKARLALLSPASTDKTVNLANVPWMFSFLPGDHQIATVLVDAFFERVGGEPFTVVSATDHDSRVFTAELKAVLAERRVAPAYHLALHPGQDVSAVVSQVLASGSQAVLIAAGAGDSARLTVRLRQGGFRGPVFGGPAMGRRRFGEVAGSAGEGAVFPLLALPESSGFGGAFHARFGREPDYAARQAYDAARLLLEAIQRAGLNRARIRDSIAELSPWLGVNGTVRWDPLGQNERLVGLATLEEGRVVPVVPAEATGRISSREDIDGKASGIIWRRGR